MIRKFELLVPKFLKKIDKQLLVNKPTLWATRFHYVMFFGAAGMALLGLKALMSPVSAANPVQPETHFLIMLIPAFLAFALWAFRTSMFSPERSFGEIGSNQALSQQFVLMACVAVFTLAPFFYGSILSKRMQAVVGTHELASDINTLNMGDVYFIISDDDYRAYPDNYFSPYTYVSGVHSQETLFEKGKDRGNDVALKKIKAYMPVFEKYSKYRFNADPANVLDMYNKGGISFAAGDDFYMERHCVKQNVKAIAKAKSGSYFFQRKEFIHFAVISSFLVWLSFMMFMRTGWKPFVFALAAGVVGLFGAGVLTSILNYAADIDQESSLILLFFGGLIFFLFQGYAIRNTKRLNMFRSVSLILAIAMLFFMPFMTVLALDWEDTDIIMTSLYSGMGLTLLGWNGTFNKRFIELLSNPKED